MQREALPYGNDCVALVVRLSLNPTPPSHVFHVKDCAYETSSLRYQYRHTCFKPTHKMEIDILDLKYGSHAQVSIYFVNQFMTALLLLLNICSNSEEGRVSGGGFHFIIFAAYIVQCLLQHSLQSNECLLAPSNYILCVCFSCSINSFHFASQQDAAAAVCISFIRFRTMLQINLIVCFCIEYLDSKVYCSTIYHPVKVPVVPITYL